MVNFMGNAVVQAYANEIAQEEHKHVQFLRAALIALTGSAISRPALNLSTSFATAAVAAGLGTGFSPYADPNSSPRSLHIRGRGRYGLTWRSSTDHQQGYPR